MSKYLVKEDDTRTYEQRHNDLPVVREEEYSEWEIWWNRTWITPEKIRNNKKNVSYNR
jgi:hypothetical protein